MFAASNCMIQRGKDYYFGGWSQGFKTLLQTKIYPPTKANYDGFIYRYQFDHRSSYDCLYEEEISRSEFNNGNWRTFYSESSLLSQRLVEIHDDQRDLSKTYLNNYYTPYISKYSGGFDLQDSMIIPKPCAYKSSNLTAVEYYRGYFTQEYKIAERNRDGVTVTQMSPNAELIY